MKKAEIKIKKHLGRKQESTSILLKVYEYIFSLISNERGKDEKEENSSS